MPRRRRSSGCCATRPSTPRTTSGTTWRGSTSGSRRMSTGCAWPARPAARSPGSQLQQWGEAGELFAAAVTLVETGDPDLVAPCVDFAEQHPESLRGLVGAIAWTAPERLGRLVRTWLDSDRPLERYLGVAACSVHRVDPHERLGPAGRGQGADRPGTSAQAGGRVGPYRSDGATCARHRCRRGRPRLGSGPRGRWRCSRARLARSPSCRRLRLIRRRRPGKAFDLALRALPLDDAKAWLGALNGDPDRARQIVIGLGVVGDPVAVPWLIETYARSRARPCRRRKPVDDHRRGHRLL